MKVVDWIDPKGRIRKAMLPDKADSTKPERGVDYGVDLGGLGLDAKYTIRLQNELRSRGLWVGDDIRRKGSGAALLVDAAIRAANSTDVTIIINEYLRMEEENHGTK